MDSRSPLLPSGKLESNALPLYNRSLHCSLWRSAAANHGNTARRVNTFEFFRFRFHFRAAERVHFPKGKSANLVRGAFGTVLRESVTPADYARLFEPGGVAAGSGPSGLKDWPRPFVFRVAHLDGLTIPPDGSFFLDVHVFDLRSPVLPQFRAAFAQLALRGIGPGRGRTELEYVEQLDLQEQGTAVDAIPAPPSALCLDPEPAPVGRVRIAFLTPTELKSDGARVERPVFPILFARLRDRVSTLRALYGSGPLEVDFFGLGLRAGSVRLNWCNLVRERAIRKSGRTGQVHPLGGFTGEAEYEGDLAEFVPWLRVARWVGVGRQTVWGKGDLRIVPEQIP